MFLVSLNHVFANILWAYGMVIIKDIKHMKQLQIALNLGLVLLATSGLLYCACGSGSFTMRKLLESFLLSGLLTAITASTIIAATSMVKNTGTISILIFVNVVVGYFISIFVYKESQNMFCLAGVIFIVVGVSKTIFQKDWSTTYWLL